MLHLAALIAPLLLAPLDAHVGDVACADDEHALVALVDDAGFGAVLATYVTDDGGFRYEALAANADHVAALDAYVAAVASTDPATLTTSQERLVFYMNAYNALTIRSVLDLWPIEGNSVLQESGFFDGRMHTVAGTSMTLNDLENNHVRNEGDPRIHFVVNCASAGCPWLANTPVTLDNLETLLEQRSTDYLRRTTVVDGSTIQVSQIFEWFAGDFGGPEGVRAFIAARLEGDAATLAANPDTTIGFFPYDWATNAR